MILGRLGASQLVRRFSTPKVVTGTILLTSVGFLVFWQAKVAILGLGGLFITGLGVASLYPLIISLALGTAPTRTVQASARATLASGTAILALPLVLGRLADELGIGPAFGVVMALLIGLFLAIRIAAAVSPAHPTVAVSPLNGE